MIFRSMKPTLLTCVTVWICLAGAAIGQKEAIASKMQAQEQSYLGALESARNCVQRHNWAAANQFYKTALELCGDPATTKKLVAESKNAAWNQNYEAAGGLKEMEEQRIKVKAVQELSSQRKDQEAANLAMDLLHEHRNFWQNYALTAACLVKCGRLEEARIVLDLSKPVTVGTHPALEDARHDYEGAMIERTASQKVGELLKSGEKTEAAEACLQLWEANAAKARYALAAIQCYASVERYTPALATLDRLRLAVKEGRTTGVDAGELEKVSRSLHKLQAEYASLHSKAVRSVAKEKAGEGRSKPGRSKSGGGKSMADTFLSGIKK